MAVYNLDFETIRQMMQAYQQTGFLSADIPSGVMSLREPCRIEVNIMSGLITSCAVVGISGQRLTGKKTVQEISRLGRLNWTFTPKPEDVTQPEQSAATAGEKYTLPRRTTIRLEQKQMHNLSRLHRAVFALADGTKTSAKIAEMLSTSPDLVDKALSELRSIGVIVFERKGDRDRP